MKSPIKIVKAKAGYLFFTQGKPGMLREDVTKYYSDPDFGAPESRMRRISFKTAPTHDEKHGRTEYLDYAVSGDVRWLTERHSDCKTIRPVEIAEMAREVKREAKRKRRFFVSGTEADAEVFAKAVRGHLGNRKFASLCAGCGLRRG